MNGRMDEGGRGRRTEDGNLSFDMDFMQNVWNNARSREPTHSTQLRLPRFSALLEMLDKQFWARALSILLALLSFYPPPSPSGNKVYWLSNKSQLCKMDISSHCNRAVLIPLISDSGIGITFWTKEPEPEPIPGRSRHHSWSRYHCWSRHRYWSRLHCWNRLL